MMPHRCAVPCCEQLATGIFCPDHYFRLPSKEARFLVRFQILMQRCDDDDMKRHMREQLHGYTQQAVRTIQRSEALTSSQAALASDRRLSSSQAAVADDRQVRP